MVCRMCILVQAWSEGLDLGIGETLEGRIRQSHLAGAWSRTCSILQGRETVCGIGGSCGSVAGRTHPGRCWLWHRQG